MFPAYGYSSAYPHGGTQMPADHPNSEAFRPEMKMQKPDPPFMYEPWPHRSGYPVPMPYHSCCDHNPYPGYYACRPPYPHFPSPQPHPQCYEAYSHHPEPYPFHYAPPPQYFPGWNYNMSVPRDFHCRGCPHNKTDMGGNKTVKIEEHEPEAEKRDSVVPVGFNNLQRPIVWIPPDYLKQEGSPSGNKPPRNARSASGDPDMLNGWFPLDLGSIKRLLEDGGVKRSQDQGSKSGAKLQEKKAEDDRKGPAFVGPGQELKSDGGVPNIWNGWMPLDLDSIKRLLQNRDLKNDQGHQPGSQKQQVSSPIIWLPYDKEEKSQMGKGEGADAASEASVQRPSNSHFIPVQEGDDQKQKTIPTIEDGSNAKGPNSTGKRGNVVKIIPVKQAEECPDTKTKDDVEGKCGENVKDIKNNKFFIDDGTRNKRVSPKKASKLPPVCLRVDPLPRKKSGKGSSRSPSPPGQRSERAEAAKSQSSASENNVDRAIEGPENGAEKGSEKLPPQKGDMVARKDTASDEMVGNRQGEVRADAEKPKSQEVGFKPDETHKPAHKVLSAMEAATIIQSAFRGYGVRRWETLKKLRRIAIVREAAVEVRKSIESAPSSIGLKQRVALGETLMKLLLELDTIQGLHPSVRDIRRSAASELVGLQERLDNLVIGQPDNSLEGPKAVESMAASDKSSMSSALSGAAGQQGGEASEQVCPENESQRDSNEAGNVARQSESLSAPSTQQIEPDVKDDAAIENPIELSRASEPCPEVPPVTEAVETAAKEKSEKPVECESVNSGFPDQAQEKNEPHTTDEAPRMMSQKGAKAVSGAEELNNEEPDTAGEMSKAEELDAPIAEHERHDPGDSSEGDDLKEQAAVFPASENVSGESYVDAIEPMISESTTEEPSPVERAEEGLSDLLPEITPIVEPENNETENPVENGTMQDEKMSEVEGNNEPLSVMNDEKPNVASEGQGLEGAPISAHEGHESGGSSEGGDRKGAESLAPEGVSPIEIPTSESTGGESERLQGLSPEKAPVVEPETNTEAEFEEREARGPTENAGENGKRQDEKLNEAGNNERPLSVMNNEKPDEASEGRGLEAPVPEHEKYKPGDSSSTELLETEGLRELSLERASVAELGNNAKAESEEGEEHQLGADSQAESKNQLVEDVAYGESRRRMVEENERMRDLVEKLIASGRQQQEVISTLNGKLKDLESKLAKRKKKRRGRVQVPRSCKISKGSSREAPVGLAS